MTTNDLTQPWVVGITGASGTIYARRLLLALLEIQPQCAIELVVSDAALRVLREEEEISTAVNSTTVERLLGRSAPNIRLHNNRDIGASIASGSYPVAGMVIAPCSMTTLAAVATGYSQTLIHRAADVTLKEGRRLVIVPRETPLSAIHLENMLTLARNGARIVPAMPGFYHRPREIIDLVDMLVMKILDQMGIRADLVQRWKTGSGATSWPLTTISGRTA